ncbi:rod shape-determining protein MreC [Candidatus Daviesbacteria bacterium]|nr:rod shape-determining protein MreC [Candidatus Daviesbacteria bacterium]
MLKLLLSDLKLFSILIIASAALFFLDSFKFLNAPKSLFQTVTVPIQYGLYKSSLNLTGQFEFILNARKASQESKALGEQLALVLSENSNLRKKLSESQAFLSQEKALSEEVFNLTPARPIGFSRQLLIDKGSDDGVKLNQSVVFKDNFIGLIKEVDPKRSKVILASDPDSRISAFSQSDAGRAKGILSGQFGSEMLLDKILHEEPIKIGDLVYSAGQELEIPRGLILGQVTEVIEKDNAVFKQAKVKSVFDVRDLDLVFIVGD